MESVLSPITNLPAEKIGSIPVSLIIDAYRTEVEIDVAEYFPNQSEVDIYRCRETGYRFYFPFSLAGNDVFYEQLQKFGWYYSDWKWDYDTAYPFITEGSKVLDIGCGYGNFLEKLKNNKSCDCTGLEFNDKAVDGARRKGLNVDRELIQDYAKSHKDEFDFVCFFQVLEHISDVNSFMLSAIACLKPGGKLIICVPNNNPYWHQYMDHHSLNMPPHHMGIWDRSSFEGLQEIYKLKMLNVRTEKLTCFRRHTRGFIEKKAKNAFQMQLMKVLSVFITAYFVINRNKIEAGSILVVYEK